MPARYYVRAPSGRLIGPFWTVSEAHGIGVQAKGFVEYHPPSGPPRRVNGTRKKRLRRHIVDDHGRILSPAWSVARLEAWHADAYPACNGGA
jgi:hypothetical protein